MTAIGRKILADTARLNLSGLVAQAAGVLQSLLLLKFIEPDDFGFWLAGLLVLSYASYASLGVEHGMALRLPYYKGQNDSRKVAVASDSAFAVWSLSAVVCSLGIAVYALAIAPDPRARYTLLTIAALVPVVQQAAFLSRWQTSVPVDFSVGARILLIQNVLALGLSAILAFLFGLIGLLIGNLLSNVVALLLWYSKTSFRYRRSFSLPLLKDLLSAGIPMLLVVIGGVLISTVDRVIILSSFGTASLGYYAVTGLGGNALYGLLSQAGSAISPHIVEASGRNTGNPAALAKYLTKPTLLFAYLSAILLLVVAAVVPAVVRGFIPKYSPGLPAFYAFVPGFFFLAIILTAGNIFVLLMIERRQRRVPVYLQCLTIGVEVLVALAAIRAGRGLIGVAFASTAAYAFYGLTLLVWTSNLVLGSGKWSLIREMLVPFVLTCLAGAALFITSAWSLHAFPLTRAAVDIGGALAVGGGLALLAVRRLGLAEELAAVRGWVRSRPPFARDT